MCPVEKAVDRRATFYLDRSRLCCNFFLEAISPNFFWGKFIESIEKLFGAEKNQKFHQTKSKIHHYFRVVHSSSPLSIN